MTEARLDPDRIEVPTTFLYLGVPAVVVLSIISLALQPTRLPIGPVPGSALEAGLSFIAVVVSIPTTVFALIWVYRLVEALPVDEPRPSPGWAVGSWFIPVVNLYAPFLALRRAWRHFRLGPDPVFHIWWGAYALYLVWGTVWGVFGGLWAYGTFSAHPELASVPGASVPIPLLFLVTRWIGVALYAVAGVAFLAVLHHVEATAEEHTGQRAAHGAAS